ncbi:SUMF1/EgtB/PvdO family nonheme iron enzyme, partial [bacterium]|nr:SUMF1/EgtB/PvdO family nonheme iron enzyme [bacterium]
MVYVTKMARPVMESLYNKYNINKITDRENTNKAIAQIDGNKNILTKEEAVDAYNDETLFCIKARRLLNIKQCRNVTKPVISMMLVPGGVFRMRDAAWLFAFPGARETEVNSFYMAKHEVTNKRWREVMQGTKELAEWKKRIAKYPKFSGDKQPVVMITWFDAIKFCNRISFREGLPKAYNEKTGELLDYDGNPTRDITKVKGYRLPTEAEWEYAAKAGGNYKYGTVNGVLSTRVAVYNQKKSANVMSKPANPFGIYDLCGNVKEYVNDWWNDKYDRSARKNPVGPKKGLSRIVIRGGSWYNSDEYFLRSGFRNTQAPHELKDDFGAYINDVGFR